MIDTRFYEHLGPIPLVKLLSTLDVKVDADISDLRIMNAAPAHLAGVSDISYFEKSRRRSYLETCEASACFVKEKHAKHIEDLGCIPIISKFPRADFSRTTHSLYRSKPYGGDVNCSFDGVEIGRNTVIGARGKDW